MKHLIIFCLLILLIHKISAQNDSIDQVQVVLETKSTKGGYGALVYKFSKINNKIATINEGRGGIIYNHKFTIGGCISAFKTDMLNDTVVKGNSYLSGYFGGILFEPILFAKKLLNLSFPIVLGIGEIKYFSKTVLADNYLEDSKLIFICEPGAEVDLKIARFFHVCFGAYYRIASSTKMNYSNGKSIGINTNSLNNFSFGISLKFGKF